MKVIGLVAAAAVLAACDGSDALRPDLAGVAVMAGPSRIDTAGAFPDQLLVVEVRDLDGRPAARVDVVFTPAGASAAEPSVHSVYERRSTDAAGRVTTRLRYGPVAGLADLTIAVPSLGISGSLRYQVLPGRPVELDAGMQVVMLGDTVRPALRVLDRNGNEATGLTTLVAGAAGVAGLTADGRIYGSDTGTGSVRVTVAGLTRTAPVTVVPFGGITGFRAGAGVATSSLDGSNARLLAASAAEPAGLDFDPATMTLVYGDVARGRIMMMDPATSSPRVFTGDAAFLVQRAPRLGADGRTLYFYGERAGESGIYRADTLDAEPVLVAAGVREADVDAAGERLVHTEGGMLVVHALKGAATATGVAGTAARWAPDGRRLAFITPAGDAGVLEVHTGAVTVIDAPVALTSVAWSPLGGWIAAGSAAGVQLIDVARARVIDTALEHALPVWYYLRES